MYYVGALQELDAGCAGWNGLGPRQSLRSQLPPSARQLQDVLLAILLCCLDRISFTFL